MEHGTVQTVLLFLWVMFTNPHTSNAVQFSVLVPDSVSAGLGSSVILPCGLSPSYDAKTFEVRWYRNEDYSNPILLYQNLKVQESAGDPQYRGRVSLIGELEKGNASLKLENLTLADRGEYMCNVEGTQWYDRANVSLVVKVLGALPVLSFTGAGERTNVTCASDGWSPQPTLIWRDKRGQELRSRNIYFITGSEGLVSVRSWLLFSALESEWISCSVVSSEGEMKEGRVLPIKASMERFWRVAFISTLVVSLSIIILLSALLLLRKRGLLPNWLSPKNQKTAEEALPLTGPQPSAEERLKVWNKLKDHKEKLTVDPETCRTPLTVTEDGTGVYLGKLDISNLTHPDLFPPALSREEFSSGLKYWEVKVDQKERSKKSWCVGVTQKPPTRETLTALCYEEVCGIYTSTDPRTEVPAEGQVTTLGLLLDFKHRLLSFYNVDLKSHLHTFTMETMKNRTYCALISPGSKDNHTVSFHS